MSRPLPGSLLQAMRLPSGERMPIQSRPGAFVSWRRFVPSEAIASPSSVAELLNRMSPSTTTNGFSDGAPAEAGCERSATLACGVPVAAGVGDAAGKPAVGEGAAVAPELPQPARAIAEATARMRVTPRIMVNGCTRAAMVMSLYQVGRGICARPDLDAAACPRVWTKSSRSGGPDLPD